MIPLSAVAAHAGGALRPQADRRCRPRDLGARLPGLRHARPGSGYLQFLAASLVIGVGAPLAMTPATNAIVASLPLEKQGVASAVNDTARELGAAFGVAVLGSAFNVGYRNDIESTSVASPRPRPRAAHEAPAIAGLEASRALGERGAELRGHHPRLVRRRHAVGHAARRRHARDRRGVRAPAAPVRGDRGARRRARPPRAGEPLPAVPRRRRGRPGRRRRTGSRCGGDARRGERDPVTWPDADHDRPPRAPTGAYAGRRGRRRAARSVASGAGGHGPGRAPGHRAGWPHGRRHRRRPRTDRARASTACSGAGHVVRAVDPQPRPRRATSRRPAPSRSCRSRGSRWPRRAHRRRPGCRRGRLRGRRRARQRARAQADRRPRGRRSKLIAAAQAAGRRPLPDGVVDRGRTGPSEGQGPMRAYLQAKADADEALRASGLRGRSCGPVSLTDDPGTGRVSVAEHVDHRGRCPATTWPPCSPPCAARRPGGPSHARGRRSATPRSRRPWPRSSDRRRPLAPRRDVLSPWRRPRWGRRTG